MSFVLLQLLPMLGVLLGLGGLLTVMTDSRKRRAERAMVESVNRPRQRRLEAGEMAQHAAEFGLPTWPWHELAAFWDLAEDGLIGHEPESLTSKVQEWAAKAAPAEHEPGPGFEFDMDAFVERTRRSNGSICRVCGGPTKRISKSQTCRPCSLQLARQLQPVKVEKEIVVRLPGQDVLRTTWQLTGTDEDAHVLEALRNHGVAIGREGLTAHLAGPREAVQAAQAEYRVGFNARRAKRAR